MAASFACSPKRDRQKIGQLLAVENVGREKRVIRETQASVNVRVNHSGNEAAVLQQEKQADGSAKRERKFNLVEDCQAVRVVLTLAAVMSEQREVLLAILLRWCVVDCQNQVAVFSDERW
ncbi:MAG: hypothetical protein AAF483_25135 [Planctomycetota bacterium]